MRLRSSNGPSPSCDDNALYNLFATWLENRFTSLPKPHGNRGIDELYWELHPSESS